MRKNLRSVPFVLALVIIGIMVLCGAAVSNGAEANTVYYWYDSASSTLYLDSQPMETTSGTMSMATVPASNASANWRDVKTVIVKDTIHPTNMQGWFQYCKNLTTIQNIENIDTSNVTNMSDLFCRCESLQEIDLSSFDTSSVTSMNSMFEGCISLKL